MGSEQSSSLALATSVDSEAAFSGLEGVDASGVALSPQRTGLLESAVTGVLALVLGVYAWLFFAGIWPYWFSPEWTTDDAYQQLFPFHAVLDSEIFQGDLIYRMMKGYLTPIHYLLGYVITWFSRDPIMTGHWMMLIQLGATLLFLYLAVSTASRNWGQGCASAYGKIASAAPALFAVAWMLHTRHVVQRLTAGLPRGWSAPVLLAFLYFVLARKHKGVLVSLLLGCLLHPPSTFIVALTYGIYLLLGSFRRTTRAEYLPKLRGYVLLSPFYMLVTYFSIRMPAEFGGMANLEVASMMPEFSRPGGRFAFVPLLPYWEEMHYFGFQAFLNKWHKTFKFLNYGIPFVAVGVVLFLWVMGLWRRREYIPGQLMIFGACCLVVHELSRLFAFYLYVPNRHLQFPMAIFFVVALSIGVWRWGTDRPGLQRRLVGGLVSLLLLGALVFVGSGWALDGRANFNTHIHQKGKFAVWLGKYSEKGALIAGHPTLVDPVPLLARRRVYISTEVAHPFYKGYYDKIKRRIEISLRAHYAESLEQLYDLVAPEGIDYYVFQRKLFYPEELAKASFFRPYDQLVFTLTRVPDPLRFAYRELPAQVDLQLAPYMPFKDDVAAVVDIHRLGKALGRE